MRTKKKTANSHLRLDLNKKQQYALNAIWFYDELALEQADALEQIGDIKGADKLLKKRDEMLKRLFDYVTKIK